MSGEDKIGICLNCANRYNDDCPMRFVELFYRSDWEEFDEVIRDNTKDNGFCDMWRLEDNETL